jgi:filamentous hemagglutinin
MTEGQSLNFNLLDVAGTMTFTSGSAVRNLTVNGTFTLSNAAITIYGNYLYTAATAISSGVSAWTFGSTSTQSINTGGLTHSFPWTFNGAGGTFNLSSAVTIGSTSTLTLTNGTLKLNGYTFISGAFATGIGTKNLTFDAGTLSIVFIGNVFNNANPTGFTTTAGTGVGTIRLTGSSAKTFTGGGSIYNCTLDQGGLGALTIADSNTFDDITNSYKATNATTLTFTSGTTTTVNNFTASGEVGRLLTINSSTPGSAATLSKSTGSVSVSYCSIFNSAATGGATWEALTTNGNINSGGNSGWIFGVVLSTGNMLLMF